jgi:hypothetical protein
MYTSQSFTLLKEYKFNVFTNIILREYVDLQNRY